MATERQIAANKANSQKSTGPKSTEGKAKSCLNHFSHGFASATARFIPGEDPEEFKALLADLTEEYQPATPTEQIFVERMTQNQWLSLRAFRLQSNSFSMGKWGVNFTISKDLGLLIRYQTGADRAFHRAHADLVKAQKERKKSEIDFEPQNAVKTADNGQRITDDVPKTATTTCVKTDFPAAPVSSAAPDARAGLEIVPEVPNFQNVSIKNAA
jgi:hypothetical protein